MLSLEGVKCDWLLTVNPYNSFLGGKLLLVRRTTIMTLMRLGPQVYKNASWYIKNAYWVLTEMCIVNVSPMNARQMIYITVAQVQCGNIPATRRLEIFTFLIKSWHRCLLQLSFLLKYGDNKLKQRVADNYLCLLNRLHVQSKWMGLLCMWCVAAAARKGG